MRQSGDWPDPLGIRADSRRVVAAARNVRISGAALERLADRLFSPAPDPPPWEGRYHWAGAPDQTANWLLALDATNFCFWGNPRWEISFRGEVLSGYWGLAAALTRAVVECGLPVWDAAYLADLSDVDGRAIFAGTVEIPLLTRRIDHLREAGQVVRDRFDGRFLNLGGAAGGDAGRVAALVGDHFASFRDVAAYEGRPVRFFKRAQILAADLVGAFGGQGPGALTGLEGLTAFADYKLPQVLRHHGALVYSARLSQMIDEGTLLPAGSPAEVEIRAATIVAVDALAALSPRFSRAYRPFEVDWLLWQAGQSLPPGVAPYHRTRTIYY
ncbi:MAG TPA: queuosine salvage family protein [Dehalococcoidia bacterium]|nr:queuosine salvage family protein [Dehalococcoidia bacterium]